MFGHNIPINPQSATGSDSKRIFIPQFNCFAVNGVLCPEPLAWALPDESPVEMEIEPRASSASAGKGKRKKSKAEIVIFQLLKSPNKGNEGYILQMHNIETGIIINYQFSVDEKNGEKKLKVESHTKGEFKAEPVTEETILNVQTKLSLQERLVGWTFEAKKRKSSSLSDEYFIHGYGKAKKTFQSVKEVGNFILFNTTSKVSSYRSKEKKTRKEKQEAFLSNVNQIPHNMDEMVVPKANEENATEGHSKDDYQDGGGEDGIF